MIEFYGLGFSPFTCPVGLQLDIKGAQYTKITPTREMVTADSFAALSPMRKVPLVVIDGTPVSESLVISELLEELYPQPALLPEGAFERARVRMIATIASLYVAAPSVHIFSNRRAEGGPQIEGDARKLLARGFAAVESALCDGPYANGEVRSVADCILPPALYFATGTLEVLGFDDLPEPGPRTKAYFDRIGDDGDIGACLKSMSEAVAATFGSN